MNDSQLQLTAQFILDCEARRDAEGKLMVYPLPSGDGGGTFEVAGINDRYDHDQAWHLRGLIEAHQYDEAEAYARAYYVTSTNGVQGWHPMPAIEAWMRDTAFNRGVGGAAKISEMATGQTVDGAFGPLSREALRLAVLDSPADALQKLRHACEAYERVVAPPVGARAKFWNGLVNRWNKRLAFAQSLLDPAPAPIA